MNFDSKRKKDFCNASSIILNTADQKGKLLAILPNIVDKIILIPQGIDLSLFKDQKLKKEKLSFGFTGRIYEHKGLLDALDFIKFVKGKYANVKYYIAGNFETEEFKNKFYNKVDKLESNENIIFEGYLTGNELIKFYNKFTYLLFLSKHESFGKSIVEAMACGAIPIIRKNSSGPEEIIENGKYGYIMPNKNKWESFLKTIESEKKIKDIGKKIEERVKQYSFENYVILLEKLYKDTSLDL